MKQSGSGRGCLAELAASLGRRTRTNLDCWRLADPMIPLSPTHQYPGGSGSEVHGEMAVTRHTASCHSVARDGRQLGFAKCAYAGQIMFSDPEQVHAEPVCFLVVWERSALVCLGPGSDLQRTPQTIRPEVLGFVFQRLGQRN
eukprot:2779963-Amphidinium_carterae.5